MFFFLPSMGFFLNPHKQKLEKLMLILYQNYSEHTHTHTHTHTNTAVTDSWPHGESL